MLVLTRNVGERVRLRCGTQIVWVQLVDVGRGKAKISIDAPRAAVEVAREELLPEAEHYRAPRGEEGP